MKSICFALIAMMILFLAGCQKEVEKQASIQGIIESASNMSVVLKSIDVLGNEIDIGHTNTNEAGAFNMEIELENPMLGNLQIGQEISLIYLEPGIDLAIKANFNEFQSSLQYEGEGVHENQYLKQKGTRIKELESKQGMLWRFPEDEFIKIIAKQKETLLSSFENYNKENRVSKTFKEFEKNNLQMTWASNLEQYVFMHPYFSRVAEYTPSDRYFSFRDGLDLNNPSLLSIPAFWTFNTAFTNNKITTMLQSDASLQGDASKAFDQMYKQIESDQSFGVEIKEAVLAKSLYDRISFFGAEGVKENMDKFAAQSRDQTYLNMLQPLYDKWATIAKGNKAPDFSYTSIEGEDISLSDFLGKVVYIDVWATWCAPCKKEFPAAKMLKQKYADEQDLVFLYISIDQDRKTWEQFLTNDPGFKGVHIFADNAWNSKMARDYLIEGIPRYMIIDKEGKIFDSNAPRPSSGVALEDTFNALLGG